MKKYAFLLIVISLIFIVFSCEKENINGNIKLQKIDYLGCFINNPENSTKSSFSGTDTIYYTIENDTLTLSVIKNYNCCGIQYNRILFNTGFKIVYRQI